MSLDPEILPPTPHDAGSEEGSLSSAGAALAIVPRGAEFLPASQPGDPMHETDRMVEEYIRASKAPATQRAYLSDWKHFVGWCERSGLLSLPAAPGTVARYITYLSKPGDGAKPRKPATIVRGRHRRDIVRMGASTGCQDGGGGTAACRGAGVGAGEFDRSCRQRSSSRPRFLGSP